MCVCVISHCITTDDDGLYEPPPPPLPKPERLKVESPSHAPKRKFLNVMSSLISITSSLIPSLAPPRGESLDPENYVSYYDHVTIT